MKCFHSLSPSKGIILTVSFTVVEQNEETRLSDYTSKLIHLNIEMTNKHINAFNFECIIRFSLLVHLIQIFLSARKVHWSSSTSVYWNETRKVIAYEKVDAYIPSMFICNSDKKLVFEEPDSKSQRSKTGSEEKYKLYD